ncbi:uncharacterized protein LOC143033958 isoform X2 [Oratosquilla oratoria]|uniref:uncharacterized protein LOC143033958 isoform X2 n=1 Tax=Oratosquilla oratoria TaxID=337810 RepID=UPI003F75BCB8
MFKNLRLRSFESYARQVFSSGSETCKRPYSFLGTTNTLPHNNNCPTTSASINNNTGGNTSVTTTVTNSSSAEPTSTSTAATYDWIYRCSGSTMPPLVGRADPPSGSSYLMAGTQDANCEVKAKLKCVLVGDGSVGKTSLIVSYTTNGYPTEYVPTAFDNYNVVVTVDNQPIRLQLCDTAGQDDFDSLRPLCYPQTDVFLVCFSVVSPTSFHNVKEKWLPEIRHHNPRAPIVLVGTQSDLRTDVKVLIELAQYREQPVSESAARKLAHQIGAVAYIESSALTQRNLKEVFDQAILSALEGRKCHSLTRSSSKRGSSRVKKSETLERRRGDYDQHSDHACIESCGGDDHGSVRKRGWRKLCCCFS